jgi:hypothetical protein
VTSLAVVVAAEEVQEMKKTAVSLVTLWGVTEAQVDLTHGVWSLGPSWVVVEGEEPPLLII